MKCSCWMVVAWGLYHGDCVWPVYVAASLEEVENSDRGAKDTKVHRVFLLCEEGSRWTRDFLEGQMFDTMEEALAFNVERSAKGAIVCYEVTYKATHEAKVISEALNGGEP